MARKRKKASLKTRQANPDSSYWRTKADTLWREMVKKRDGFRCVICGEKNKLNVHHLVSRKCKHWRCDIDNGITLCPSHHTFNNKLSAHRAPATFCRWLQKHRPGQWELLCDRLDSIPAANASEDAVAAFKAECGTYYEMYSRLCDMVK